MLRLKTGPEAKAGEPAKLPYGKFSGKLLIILASFADTNGKYPESGWASVITEISNYYWKASNHKVLLSSANETFGTANNGVVGWLNLGYAHPNPGANTDDKNQKIAKDAIIKANPYVDYKSFDTNNDEFVDANELAILVVVAGNEASYSKNSPGIWAHRWCLDSIGAPKLDKVTIGGALPVFYDGACVSGVSFLSFRRTAVMG